MKNYYVYKTTNNINEKFYIGVSMRQDANYFGSGRLIIKAIKKHGKENFSREILRESLSKKQAYEIENKLVDFKDPNCYNQMPGGCGGFEHINSLGLPNPMKNPAYVKNMLDSRNRNMTPERRQKNKETAIKNLKHAVAKNTGRKNPLFSRIVSERNKKRWSDDYENFRNSLASYFEVISPEGDTTLTNRLEDFCKERGLTYTSVWNTSNTNKPVSKGKAIGWKCRKI